MAAFSFSFKICPKSNHVVSGWSLGVHIHATEPEIRASSHAAHETRKWCCSRLSLSRYRHSVSVGVVISSNRTKACFVYNLCFPSRLITPPYQCVESHTSASSDYNFIFRTQCGSWPTYLIADGGGDRFNALIAYYIYSAHHLGGREGVKIRFVRLLVGFLLHVPLFILPVTFGVCAISGQPRRVTTVGIALSTTLECVLCPRQPRAESHINCTEHTLLSPSVCDLFNIE